MSCMIEPHKPSTAPLHGREYGHSNERLNKYDNNSNSDNNNYKKEFAETVHETTVNMQSLPLSSMQTKAKAAIIKLDDVNACPAMHDVEFYKQVANELGVAAPVLHSVVYTHCHFNDNQTKKCEEEEEEETEQEQISKATENESKAANINCNQNEFSSEELNKSEDGNVEKKALRNMRTKLLNAEMHKVDEHVWQYEARRLQEMEIQTLSANLHCKEEIEEQMKRRIQHKREMEQMRAVHRMESLASEMATNLEQIKVALITHSDQKQHLTSSSSSASFSCKSHEYADEELEVKTTESTLSRDKFSELSLISAKVNITAMREAQVAQLTEDRLHRLENERFLCNQGHDIGKLSIEQEETHERRRLYENFLSIRLLINLIESEGKLRMLIERSEHDH